MKEYRSLPHGLAEDVDFEYYIIKAKIEIPTYRSPPCHTLCNHHMPLNNKCWIRPVAWPPPRAYALVISIETESRIITEDHTLPVAHSPAYPTAQNI
ncbi:hypothetical protein TNCV_496771 [Trichonephila clavipes]|nr:hypothetical protein TNCV_496771 [Trichonephila clavipes]